MEHPHGAPSSTSECNLKRGASQSLTSGCSLKDCACTTLGERLKGRGIAPNPSDTLRQKMGYQTKGRKWANHKHTRTRDHEPLSNQCVYLWMHRSMMKIRLPLNGDLYSASSATNLAVVATLHLE